MHGIVRMWPLPLQAHLFFLCLSHLLNRGSGLSHGSTKDDTVREFQDLHHAESERILSWTEIYVPVRRCHAILKNKMGEFSIPVIRNRHFKNVWCNWTIWAGPRNHIIIYVQGFRGSKDCEENPDKIIFQGVTSVVESTIAYACWNKRVHIYATQALAVNVALLLKNYGQSHRYRYFRGKYYIFRDPRAKASQREEPTSQVPFQRPSNKLPYSSIESKVEIPVVMSQGGREMASPELMPSKALQPERSYTWEREKVEFSETSLPYSERPSDKSRADGIMVTKTLGVSEISLGDELFSKALKKTAALDTRWLEIVEEKSILSPGSTMDGSAVDREILYENTPYFLGPEQSTIMEDWYINIKSGSTDNQTEYLIPTSEDVPINIKPTPISHSIFIIVSDSEFLEKTGHSKNEKTQISPSQIWSSLPGSEQQPILQTEVLTHEAVTLSTDSMGNHMSGISLASETRFPLESSLHLIPVVPTVHTAAGFSKSVKGGDLLTDPHSGVVISLGTIQTLEGSGMIWLNSPEIFSEAGLTLIVASADGIGLVPELPSTISIRSTMVRAEGELELLLQTARSLLGPAEIENLASSAASEEVPSRHQVSPAETNLKFILGQERSLPFTAYQENLFDAELTPTSPQVVISEIVSEWALQDIPVPTSAYHNEQVTTEQSLGIPLTLTPVAMLKVKWPSVTSVETRTELDSMLFVQNITTPFASVNHEESRVATMFSLEIPLNYHLDFAESNMERYFFNPAVVSLAFLPTPTLSINEDELALSSLSSHSWAALGEMFTSVGKTEPLAFFTSRNVDFATSVSCPKCLALDLRNLSDLLEGEHFIDKKTQSISQLIPKGELSQGRDASSGSEISLVTKTYKMTPLSALQWIPTRIMTFSSELEIQNEVTVQPSKKDALVNESNLWKSSNSLGKDQKLTKFNFTSLVPGIPAMSLGKWDQTGDLSAVSSSLALWSKDTNLLEDKKLQDSNQVLTSTNMVACIPMKRCHVVLKDNFGTFSLPENLNSSWLYICCNWTIWAGYKKHIVVYIKRFEGPENCDQNQDKIIFQGVSSSVERKTFYACKSQGTLIFATQALAVHIMFLSVRSYPRHIPAFEGQYFVFTDPERQVPPKPAIASPLATSQRLRERILSKKDSHPELMTKPQSGSFPNLNTIYMGLENKSQMVTEILMPKNKELIEGEGKALEWKHPHGLLTLIPAKGPLIKNQKSLPISLRQEFNRPTETIKNSAGRDSLSMTLIPVTSYGYKPENKASQDSLPGDSLIIHPDWPSKTFPLRELPLKPVGIPDRLLPSSSVQEQRMPWITTKTEKLVWQGDLVITKSSNLYSPLTAQSIREPQDAVYYHDHLYQSFSHVMLVKGKKFLEIRPRIDESVTGPPNIPKEELSSNLLFNDEQVAPESSATGKGRVGETSPTRHEVSRGVSLDPAQSSTLENIRHLDEELLDWGSSREVTTSSGFVWDSISPSSLTEHSPSLKTSRTALSFLQEVIDSIHPNTGAVHSSAPMPNFKAKAMVPLTSGQVWKNMTAGVSVLTPGYSDARTTFPSFGNESVLELQHYPGDILYEVIVEMECRAETPYNASEVEKVLVDSLKQEIGGNLGHFSPEADAFKLTGMKRKDTSNATFIFWLHLRSRERNMSDTLVSQLGAPESSELHSQLRTLIRDTVEALQLHLKSTSIHDVNECEIGLEQCGDGAECFNGVGTYMCHCKEDYEDHSPMQTGTLCVHVPRSGAGFSFNYLDLLIAVAVFASVLLMLLIGFVWLATRTNQEERDFCLQETMSLAGVSTLPQTQTKACLNLRKFNKCPVYNPYQPKPPARVTDGSLGQIPHLNKDSHVCMEQSEYLK